MSEAVLLSELVQLGLLSGNTLDFLLLPPLKTFLNPQPAPSFHETSNIMQGHSRGKEVGEKDTILAHFQQREELIKEAHIPGRLEGGTADIG